MSEKKDQPKESTQTSHVFMTGRELQTLGVVLAGYMGFLSNISELKAIETTNILQGVGERLSGVQEGSTLYFNYGERIAILEAVTGFKILLATTPARNPRRDVALVEVEHLLQCLVQDSLSAN